MEPVVTSGVLKKKKKRYWEEEIGSLLSQNSEVADGDHSW